MKRLMKYQGGGLAKRSRFGGVARYAASTALSAVPYGRAAMVAYRGAKALYRGFRGSRGSRSQSKRKTDDRPSAPVETGYAVGHSAYNVSSKHKRLSKRAYKKKQRFEIKVRAAVNGVSKFQQYFQNAILGPAVAVDEMSWFEIPVMCGQQYVAPGTSTDANNIYFRVNNDEGDFVPAADIANNSNWTRQQLTGQTQAGTAVGSSSGFFVGAKFLVYGYVLEYNIQNVNSVPITVEIFEMDCIKDYEPSAGAAPFGTSTCAVVGSTSCLKQAAGENTARQALVVASGTQIAVSDTAVGVTPFLFSDMGNFFRVVKSHVHVLDPSQIMRLQKKYFFKGPIRVTDMNNVMMKKGVSHFIVGSVRATAIGAGSYAGALTGAAAGLGGFTHTYCVNYNKRFMIKPLDIGNTPFGMRNQVL